MQVRRFAVSLWLIAAGCTSQQLAMAANVELSCDRAIQATLALPESGDAVIAAVAGQTAWIDLQENGVDAIIAAGGEGALRVSVPTRYGRYLISLEGARSVRVRRAQPSRTPADMKATLLCGGAADRVAWYRRAAALSGELLPVPSGRPLEELLADVERLQQTAPDAAARALVEHLRAQCLYTANRTNDSVHAFAAAEDAWSNVGDRERALVAHVGRVEELVRAAKYEEAEALIPGRPAADSYFANRLSNVRCQLLRYRGRLKEAIACYSAGIEWLRRHAENAELASALLDQSEVYRRIGRFDFSEPQVRQAKAVADGPYAPLLRGRAELLLYDLHLDRGDVSGAIDDVHAALEDFASMRATRWEANTLVRAAELYLRLGAVYEARTFLDKARSLFSEKDAPSRIALLWEAYAEAFRQDGAMEEALQAAQRAARIYGQLGMAVELKSAQATVVDLQLSSGRFDDAEQLFDQYAGDDATVWTMLHARRELLRGDAKAARHWLDRLDASAQPGIAQNIARIELESRWLALVGRRAQALEMLREAKRRVDLVADTVGNPLLADLLRRQVAPLRAAFIRLLLDDPKPLPDDARAAAAWEWMETLHDAAASSAARTGVVERFDRSIAEQLLGERNGEKRPSDDKSSRNLLDILTGSPRPLEAAAVSARTLPSLDRFRASLGRGSVFVAYFDAGVSGAMLWVMPEHVRLVQAPAMSVLAGQVAKLDESIASAATPLAQIDAEADALSMQLLATAPGAIAPERLLVADGTYISAIPWAALRWRPGGPQLVDGTATSYVMLDDECCAPELPPPDTVRILLAQKQETSDTAPIAAMESRLLNESFADSRFAVQTLIVPDRGAFLGSFAASGNWIHVAAHGETESERIGYTGLWLDAQGGGAPAFVSSLDMFASPVSSELVVLGSCALGRRGSLPGEPFLLNFADAVERAGARNVVAAQWPVSDAAMTLWIPAFYRSAISNEAFDFGRALQEAQKSLLRNRRYRHPFYWAPFVHKQRLSMTASGHGADIGETP